MTSPAPPRVTIVIRCYTEEAHIGRLFEEVKKQTFTDFEVIVVDSGSTDRTIDIVHGEDAELLPMPKEVFSFGRSLNMGCRVARGEFLVFISAHCYPEREDWLANLVSGFKDEKVAVVYGKQRGIPESHCSERQIFKRWFPDESVPRQDNPFSNNANCAIRRSLWKRIPYDESLTGLEDVAWAQKVIRDGWWAAYLADAGEVHGKTSTLLQLGVGFIPELTGRRNVYLGGLAAGMCKHEIDDRFDEIVEYAELEDAIDRPIKTCSAGMFSRLAFSVAMNLDPEVLLLDEILAVGDASFQGKSVEAMRQLLDKAGTILFVSHSLGSVEEFCDRAIWLNEGHILAEGHSGEVVAAYRQWVKGKQNSASPGRKAG